MPTANSIQDKYVEIQILNSGDLSEISIPGKELVDSDISSVASVVPFLIRSGNTEKVEVYLHYSGTKPANSIRFKSLILKECNLLLPEKTYGTFTPSPPYIYSTHAFPAGVIGSVRIGDVSIPTDKSSVRVNTSDLQVFYMSGGWNSFSNITGCWTLN